MRIHVQYFAILREQARRAEELRDTASATPAQLYAEVRAARGLTLPQSLLRVAVNDEFSAWDTPLRDGDRVVFIPPVAGG